MSFSQDFSLADQLAIVQSRQVNLAFGGVNELASQQLGLSRKSQIREHIILLVLGSLLLVLLLSWLRRYLLVRARYSQMIQFVDQARSQGHFDFTSGFILAWCAEYPNFTGLLASRIINRNYPKAVALAYYTPPYSETFNEDNLAEAGFYLNAMFDYSELHSEASAQEIICETWGYDAGISDCLEPCPIIFSMSAGDVTASALQGVAEGIFVGSTLTFLVPETAMVAASASLAWPFFAVTALLSLGLGTARAIGTSKQKQGLDDYCQNFAEYNCRSSSSQQCV